jgi:hypothetical protein
VEALPEAELVAFDEKRGGCGLQPSIARRVIAAHHGRIWSTREEPPPDPSDYLSRNRRAEAVLVLPEGQ